MTWVERVSGFFFGNKLIEASKDLHDSSQWTREQMAALCREARRTTERAEEVKARTLKVLEDWEGKHHE